MKKTSLRWYSELQQNNSLEILIPDGWGNNKEGESSFYNDLITKEDFLDKLNNSTLKCKYSLISEKMKNRINKLKEEKNGIQDVNDIDITFVIGFDSLTSPLNKDKKITINNSIDRKSAFSKYEKKDSKNGIKTLL